MRNTLGRDGPNVFEQTKGYLLICVQTNELSNKRFKRISNKRTSNDQFQTNEQ